MKQQLSKFKCFAPKQQEKNINRTGPREMSVYKMNIILEINCTTSFKQDVGQVLRDNNTIRKQSIRLPCVTFFGTHKLHY